MAFNVLYGIVFLVLFLHMQHVRTTDIIHKSKGYGGYGYGGDAVPVIQYDIVGDLLCRYCAAARDWYNYGRFCQRGRGFGRWGGAIGGYAVIYPTRHQVLCHYCWVFQDGNCIQNFCW